MDTEYNTWVSVKGVHSVKDYTMQVSPEGRVLDSRGAHNPSYLSTNGMLYEFVQTTDGKMVLYPFDVIMAVTFIPIPQELIGKMISVKHKNGRLHDCHYTNLEWVEGNEEWKPIEYGDIRKGYYEISNFGRVRSMLTDPPTIMRTERSSRYDRLWLAVDGCNDRAKHFSVHRLVAWHFVQGYTPERNCVNHIDCDHFNNNYTNLEWVTIKENNKHAYDSGLIGHGDNSPTSKISEKDAVEVCYALNRNDGSIIDAYNELKSSIPTLTYPIVTMIKYGETFTYISDRILTDEGRIKQVRQTDPDVILDAARCLKKYNGDVKKTKKELQLVYPWVSYGWLWHLKDKSVASDITDLVFTKDEFPKCIPLTETDAMMIINSLIAHKGDPYVNQTVYDELKDKIEGLTKDKIRSIKEKKAWKTLSDKYFLKGEI